MNPMTAPIVLIPGSPAWRVVHEALEQFVSNNGDFLASTDEEDPEVKAKQEVAEAVMEKFDAAYAALADAA